MKILLSELALPDLSNDATGLRRFIELLKPLGDQDLKFIHKKVPNVKILKNHHRPTLWRYRVGKYRTLFTITCQDGEPSVVIHYSGHRRNVYDRLPTYLRRNEIQTTDIDEIPDEDDNLVQIENDSQFSDYKRFYLLPCGEQESDRHLVSFASGDYIYYPCLSSSQKSIAYTLSIQKPGLTVYRIQGSAGTGKTTTAIYLLGQLLSETTWPILLLPNEPLARFAYKSFRRNHPPIPIVTELDTDQTDPGTAKVGIFTVKDFLNSLTPNFSPIRRLEAHQRIISVLRNHRINPKNLTSLEDIPWYDLYLGFVSDSGYGIRARDIVAQTYQAAVDVLRNLKSKIDERLAGLTILDQAKRIESELAGHVSRILELAQERQVILIIDEVQDLYWFQLKTLIKLFSLPHRQLLLILSGDQNQRVNISGFSWESLSEKLNHEFQTIPIALDELKRNYRNTKYILSAARYVLCEAFHKRLRESLSDRFRAFPDPGNPENCYEVGSKVTLVYISDELWVEKFINELSNEEGPDGKFQRYIFITFTEKPSPSPDVDKVMLYPIREVKGQEFDSVVLVQPFLPALNGLTVDYLYQWYTAITRGRRHVTIIINWAELDWLNRNAETNYREKFNLVHAESFEAFSKILRENASSFVNRYQILEYEAKKVFQWVLDVMQGQKCLQDFRDNSEGLKLWELMNAVFARADEYCQEKDCYEIAEGLRQFLERNVYLSEHLTQYLMIYAVYAAATKNTKNAEDYSYLIDYSYVFIEDLSSYLNKQPWEPSQIADQVDEPWLKVLIYRAATESWSAAQIAGEFLAAKPYYHQAIESICRDLERRGLILEAIRLKHEYLGGEISHNELDRCSAVELELIQGVLTNPESLPLVEAICVEFVNLLQNCRRGVGDD